MAKASITYRWASGDALMVEVKADDGYPQTLAELEARALSMLREAWLLLPDSELERDGEG